MDAREPDPGFRYWAFVSYSHQDESWGRWLHRALESWRLPQGLVGAPIAAGVVPARLAPVFRDRDELPTATDLGQTVSEALRQSWSLVVVCSPAAAASRWVNEEVRAFQRLGRGDRIHCLLVAGEGNDPTPCFPPALREAAGFGEPVAADVRRGGDGRSAARLKLVAGILGLPYDRLVQRDHQRSYRRVVAFAAAAVFALAVLATFTLVTLSSRREAEAQRGHAEGLVEFMLGDLRRKLEPEGKLATLDAVGKEALAYYAAQDPASLDADALARRARALHQIGEVADQRGQLDDALAVFRQAADSTAELLARDPDNSQRIFDHAQSVYWVGVIAYQRGQYASAETAFRDYKRLASRLVEMDPDDVRWLTETSYADSNLGTLLKASGRTDEAAQLFEEALATAKVVADRSPADVKLRFELAQAHAWLADARAEQGQLGDAQDQREAEVAIYEQILATDTHNRDAQDGLLVAERELGQLAMNRGRTALAVMQLQRATALADVLLQSDRENTTFLDHASSAHVDLATALGVTGQFRQAKAEASRARSLATSLVGRDPTVIGWQVRLGKSLLAQATLDGKDDALDSLRVIQGVLQRLDALGSAQREDRQARLLYAHCLLAIADRQATLGDTAQARRDRQEAVATIGRVHALKGPEADAMLAVALVALDRGAEAAPLMRHLAAIGYREPSFERFAVTFNHAADAPTEQASLLKGG
jgi:tetratricopeptide (TPR) repeat protein